jgi:hypothetical protein
VLVVSRAALMLVLLLAVRFMSPSVAVKLTPVRLMLPCGWLESSESHSKAEIKFVIKNSVNVKFYPCVKAILQAKLEDDIGFIEQIDIDEMVCWAWS